MGLRGVGGVISGAERGGRGEGAERGGDRWSSERWGGGKAKRGGEGVG